VNQSQNQLMGASTQQAVSGHYDALSAKAALSAFAPLSVFLPVYLLLP
jgi:hypothetical protein